MQDERGPRKSKTPKVTQTNTAAPKNWKPRSKIIIYIYIYIRRRGNRFVSRPFRAALLYSFVVVRPHPVGLTPSRCVSVRSRVKRQTFAAGVAVFRRVRIRNRGANILDEPETVPIQRPDGPVAQSRTEPSAEQNVASIVRADGGVLADEPRHAICRVRFLPPPHPR